MDDGGVRVVEEGRGGAGLVRGDVKLSGDKVAEGGVGRVLDACSGGSGGEEAADPGRVKAGRVLFLAEHEAFGNSGGRALLEGGSASVEAAAVLSPDRGLQRPHRMGGHGGEQRPEE